MIRTLIITITCLLNYLGFSQSTISPNTGNAYLLFGPNSNWNEYLQVGGNGRVTSYAGVFATNGNLHLDSKDGNFGTYINYYSQTNTVLNGQGGKVGIGTTNPSYSLDVNSSNYIISRFSRTGSGGGAVMEIENAAGTGTWRLGVGSNDHFGIYKSNEASFGKQLIIHDNGNIGIGTTTPDSKLTVKGKVHAEEVKVDLSVPGPDYVFKEGYNLRSLEEVKKYIKENGHLPNIPSAKEMETDGVELGIMNMKLLEKIEELTLYIIQLKKENNKILGLEARLKKIEENQKNNPK